MILEKKYKEENVSPYDRLCKKSNYAIFLKNLCLENIKIRLLINANNKFYFIKTKFILAWSIIINDKAYTDRRRIFRRDSCSSCQ